MPYTTGITAYAMNFTSFGGPEVLTKHNYRLTRPSPGEVLVTTSAIGANPLDYKMRDGSSGLSKNLTFPAVVGREASGVVLAVGEGVAEFRPGDQVFGMRSHADSRGTYSSHNMFNADELVRIPEGLTPVKAAALPVVGLTAYQAVVDLAQVRAGETVVIHGAGGGVGRIATQLCLAAGAEVVAVASSAHHDMLTGWGARHLDYTRGDVFAQLREEFPGGVDVVIDGVYFDTFIPSLDIIAGEGRGRIVVLPSLADLQPAHDRGITAHIPEISPNRQRLQELAARVLSGELDVTVAQTYPLTQASEVHRILESGHAPGKLVLIP